MYHYCEWRIQQVRGIFPVENPVSEKKISSGDF